MQILYGVASGDGYTSWDCSVPCQACNSTYGTCQYDGSCECVTGWYGEDCSEQCKCSMFPGINSPVNTTLLQTVYSTSGVPIQAYGNCLRDGSCSCYPDDDNVMWAGPDCYTKCGAREVHPQLVFQSAHRKPLHRSHLTASAVQVRPML